MYSNHKICNRAGSHDKIGLRHGMGVKTGPNDARRVVWAIGEFFLIYSSCFFSTNWCFIEANNEICDRKASHDENGPKRCHVRRLGPRWLLLLFVLFLVLTHSNNNSNKEIPWREREGSHDETGPNDVGWCQSHQRGRYALQTPEICIWW